MEIWVTSDDLQNITDSRTEEVASWLNEDARNAVCCGNGDWAFTAVTSKLLPKLSQTPPGLTDFLAL
ncbi:hypothetical protein CHARACLAT_010040 [Characodon lateralis]|uniref:Uncharacterized protein n=1 Tax=Characodon lateralis TaxID=208331 RepID=A0ABU7CLZ1_9TELE|nr:hypothetical protein [Characodon lateralis]